MHKSVYGQHGISTHINLLKPTGYTVHQQV